MIKKQILIFVLVFSVFIRPSSVLALSDRANIVGATYYGGYFDEEQDSWFIDNVNQCTRIENGEFTAESLGAKISEECSDDNGLGYVDNEPLHNRVSFAELSNNYLDPDFAALGDLPYGSKLEINYNGKCLIAEKLDIGLGGTDVKDYHRSIDLWWQTAKTLGFESGFDVVSVRLVDANTPLTPLGKLIKCSDTSTTATAVSSTQSQSQTYPTTTISTKSLGGDQVASKSKLKTQENEEESRFLFNNLCILLGIIIGFISIGLSWYFLFYKKKQIKKARFGKRARKGKIT